MTVSMVPVPRPVSTSVCVRRGGLDPIVTQTAAVTTTAPVPKVRVSVTSVRT